MKNFPPFFFCQNYLLTHTNSFSFAIKSPLDGYIHYATIKPSPFRCEFLASLCFLLYSYPDLSQFTDPFSCLKSFTVCRSLQKYRCSQVMQLLSQTTHSPHHCYIWRKIFWQWFIYEWYLYSSNRKTSRTCRNSCTENQYICSINNFSYSLRKYPAETSRTSEGQSHSLNSSISK